MAWPKTVIVRGIPMPVDSWEEMGELIERFGGEALVVAPQQGLSVSEERRQRNHSSVLSPGDRALLQQFVEGAERGVLITHISPVLGKRGKGTRPALERWSRKIGLVTEDAASAFQNVKRADGRGYRLNDVYLRGARDLLDR